MVDKCKVLDVTITTKVISITIQEQYWRPETLFLPTSDFWAFIVVEKLHHIDEDEPLTKLEFLTEYKPIAEGIIRQKWRTLPFKRS